MNMAVEAQRLSDLPLTPGRILYQTKSFTTQLVPQLVYDAVCAKVREIGLSLEVKGAFDSHMAVRVHPNDWAQLLQWMRQQGKYDDRAGPLGSIELDGLTVLQDVGAKVPHLELVVG
jgi:hypothetical protein